MINNVIENAAVEVLKLYEEFEPQIREKVPNEFINNLKDVASKDYEFNYDYEKAFSEQDVLPLTKGFIAYIYVNYICNQTEKEEYMNNYRKHNYELEMQKKEKYNNIDIFYNVKKVENKKVETEKIDLPVKVEKKNIFQKLIDKIKKIIKR